MLSSQVAEIREPNAEIWQAQHARHACAHQAASESAGRLADLLERAPGESSVRRVVLRKLTADETDAVQLTVSHVATFRSENGVVSV